MKTAIFLLASASLLAAQAVPPPPPPAQAPQAPKSAPPLPAKAPETPPPPPPIYVQGMRAVNEANWAKAAADMKAAQAEQASDSALYWQAYSEAKMAQQKQALDHLQELQKEFPKSNWAPDARALELQLASPRIAMGRMRLTIDDGKIDPKDELKMLAINGLMQNDPKQALPALERVLTSNDSPAVKQRALFVLAQSHTPEATAAIARLASTTTDAGLKSSSVASLAIAGDDTDLIAIARKTTDPQLKRQIVENLANMHTKAATQYLLEILNNDE